MSKRAQNLVKLCKFFPGYNDQSDKCRPDTVRSTTFTPASVLSPWWDDVFEAADITWKPKHRAIPPLSREAVKKILFSSPSKGGEQYFEPIISKVLPRGSKCVNGASLLSASEESAAAYSLHSFDSAPSTSLSANSQRDIDVSNSNGGLKTLSNESVNNNECHFKRTFSTEVSEGQLKSCSISPIKNKILESPKTNLEGDAAKLDDQEPHSTIILLVIVNNDTGGVSKHQKDSATSNLPVGGQVKDQKLCPSLKKIQEVKIAHNFGMAHFNLKGKPKPARVLRPPCTNRCKRCAYPRLSDEERLTLSREFWNLGNHEKQWAYIKNCINVCATKRRFALPGTRGSKQCHREYSFRVGGISNKRVCKTMFTQTLCISDSWINSALSHYCDDGVPIPDGRGKRMKGHESQ